MHTFIRAILLTGTFLFTISLSVSGQPSADEVRVRGQVVDQNHAVVTGAIVLVSNLLSKPYATASSDTNGEFSFSLPAGEYVLDVKAEGFDSTSRKLRVSPDEKNTIEVSLVIASAI